VLTAPVAATGTGGVFLLKLGSKPVIAAIPVKEARIRATAAAAVKGCIFGCFSDALFSLSMVFSKKWFRRE
jgi:hypothetical protein